MKKLYFLVIALVIGFAANSQCIIDTTNHTLGFTPPDSTAPPIHRGTALDSTFVAQVYVPASVSQAPVTVTIYWIDITSISGLPTGITYAKNPTNDTIFGGGRACILLSGTTMDPVGTYPLTFDGFVRFKATPFINNDTTFTIAQLNTLGAAAGINFGYKVKVAGGVGINEINEELNNALQVIPNPNNGRFEIKLNYNGTIDGTLSVVDVTGRTVYNRNLEATSFYSDEVNLSGLAKGLYAVKLQTANGFASKMVSVE